MSKKEPSRVEEVAHSVFDFLSGKFGVLGEDIDAEDIRLGLGLAMCSVHRVYLNEAKTQDEKLEAAKICYNTVDRLMQSLKVDIEEAGIEGCSVVCVEMDATTGEVIDRSDGDEEVEGVIH